MALWVYCIWWIDLVALFAVSCALDWLDWSYVGVLFGFGYVFGVWGSLDFGC